VTPDLAASQAECRAVVTAAESSFTPAFRLLPQPKRQAMTALYAFFRRTDDVADSPEPVEIRRAHLDRWEANLEACLRGDAAGGIHLALADAVRRFGVNADHLRAVIAGVRMDLEPLSFGTEAELVPYLDRVASAVGLACIPVWGTKPGVTDADTDAPARAAGRAFQRTNILRDLGEDARGGRCYLPTVKLERFGVAWPPTDSSAFRALVADQVELAERDYQSSRALGSLLCRDGRAVFELMSGVYRKLLRRIAANPAAVLTSRVRVPRPTKLRLLAKAFVMTWGPK